MAKYCEIAGKITNCTDVCSDCLKEENVLKIGDRVKYLKDASNYDECEKCFYPPAGTIGILVAIEDDNYLIQWPYGTTKDAGRWYVGREDIEPAQP